MIADARWIRLWEVFHEALERPRDERESFVATACVDDDEVRREVVSLLLSHDLAEGAWALASSDGRSAGGMNSLAVHDRIISALEGKRIGRYVVGRLIASGGSGAVYEAQQSDPSRTVALKVIRAGMADRRAMRRFEFEAEVLARLHHPNIAQVFEAGTFDLGEGGQPYLAMEFINGPPMTEFVQRESLGIARRIELMILVCEAVHHAHQRGVIHRDLKPANILVDEESGSPQPKVLDFGVARLIDSDVSATVSRQLNEVAGTIPYMSPEQFGGDPRKVDVPSDVYSLGVICYEMLTGTLPLEFTSRSIFDAAAIARERPPTPLSAHNPKLRGDLETIIHKAMAKDAAQRYASAADLAVDLRRYLNTEPVSARAPSRRYRMTRFVQRNKALTLLTCAALMALVAGAGISMWQAVRATRAETRATQRFEDVRSLAKTVIFDLETAIADLPGSTPARRLLVESALLYLDRISIDAGNDPALVRELVESYVRLGNVQGMPSTANLGDYDGAIKSFETAIELWSRLADIEPAGSAAPYELADTRWRLATTLHYLGRLQEAANQYSRFRAAMREMGRADPQDVRAMRTYVAACYGAISIAQDEAQGEVTRKQLILAREASDDVQRLWRVTPETPEQQAIVGAVHLSLAMLHLRVNRLQESIDELSLAEPLLAVSMSEGFEDTNRILDYGDVFRHRARAQLKLGEPEAAAGSYRRAREVYQLALQRHPNEFRIEHIISLASAELATALVNSGDLEAAATEVDESVVLMEARFAADPLNIFRLRAVAEMRQKQAEVLAAAGNDNRADPALRLQWLHLARDALMRSAQLAEGAVQRGAAAEPGQITSTHTPVLLATIEAQIAAIEAQAQISASP